jgi:hypothetical protein
MSKEQDWNEEIRKFKKEKARCISNGKVVFDKDGTLFHEDDVDKMINLAEEHFRYAKENLQRVIDEQNKVLGELRRYTTRKETEISDLQAKLKGVEENSFPKDLQKYWRIYADIHGTPSNMEARLKESECQRIIAKLEGMAFIHINGNRARDLIIENIKGDLTANSVPKAKGDKHG